MLTAGAFRGDPRNDMVLRRDFPLARGIWCVDVPGLRSVVYFLVTSDAYVDTAWLPWTASDQERESFEQALYDRLDEIDPAPVLRLVPNEPTKRELSPRAARILADLGLVLPGTGVAH